MNILQRYLSLIQVQLVLILKTPVFNSKIVQYTNFLCAFSIYVYPHSSGWVIALLLQYCRVFLQFESIAKSCLPFGCGDGVGVFFLFAVFCYCRYSRQRCYCYCKILDFIQVKLTDRWTDIRQKRLTSVVCGFVKIFSVFFQRRFSSSWLSQFVDFLIKIIRVYLNFRIFQLNRLCRCFCQLGCFSVQWGWGMLQLLRSKDFQ